MDIEKEKDKNRQIGLPKVCVRERERERERENVWPFKALPFFSYVGHEGHLLHTYEEVGRTDWTG